MHFSGGPCSAMAPPSSVHTLQDTGFISAFPPSAVSPPQLSADPGLLSQHAAPQTFTSAMSAIPDTCGPFRPPDTGGQFVSLPSTSLGQGNFVQLTNPYISQQDYLHRVTPDNSRADFVVPHTVNQVSFQSVQQSDSNISEQDNSAIYRSGKSSSAESEIPSAQPQPPLSFPSVLSP